MSQSTAEEKIKKFYRVVAALQTPQNCTLGLLVVKKQTLGDIATLAPNPNVVTTIDADSAVPAEDVITALSDAMRSGRTALIRIHTQIDPSVYNQLFLLAQNGSMEYPCLEERIFVNVNDGASVILVLTDSELEQSNYPELMNIVGVVERL